jgi:hypothetical protein
MVLGYVQVVRDGSGVAFHAVYNGAGIVVRKVAIVVFRSLQPILF